MCTCFDFDAGLRVGPKAGSKGPRDDAPEQRSLRELMEAQKECSSPEPLNWRGRSSSSISERCLERVHQFGQFSRHGFQATPRARPSCRLGTVAFSPKGGRLSATRHGWLALSTKFLAPPPPKANIIVFVAPRRCLATPQTISYKEKEGLGYMDGISF